MSDVTKSVESKLNAGWQILKNTLTSLRRSYFLVAVRKRRNIRTPNVSSAVVRVLAFHQCDPGSIPARRHMWLEFVVGSCPCSEGFSPDSQPFSSLLR